jgi:hypothetical protein
MSSPLAVSKRVASSERNHGKYLVIGVGERYRGNLRIAEQEPPAAAAHCVADRVGGRQRRLRIGRGVERELAIDDRDPRHQGVRRLLQALVAPDDARRDIIQVVDERAAEREQHERHGQPEDQLAADGVHGDLASSNR